MKNYFKNKKVIFLMACISLIALCGCGEKSVDYYVATEQDASHGVYLKEQLNAEDKWEETVINDTGNYSNTFKIQVEPEIPEAGSMNIIEFEWLKFTEEEKKDIIEGIHADKVEVVEKNDNASSSDGDKNVEEACYVVEKNGHTFDVAMGYLKTSEKGYFAYSPTLETMKYISGMPEYDTYVLQRSDTHYKPSDDFDLTEEQIEKLACDFLGDLGFGEYTMVECNGLSMYMAKNENLSDGTLNLYDENAIPIEGAYIKLARTVDGIVVDWDNAIQNYEIYENEQKMKWIKEKYPINTEDTENFTDFTDSYASRLSDDYQIVSMCINKDGVIQCDYYEPSKAVSVKAENVKLVSYANIQEFYKKALENVIVERPVSNPVYGETFSIKHMKLLYRQMDDPDNPGKYSIIPVWRLEDDGAKDGYGNHFCVLLNAMDGSFISVYPVE